MLSSRKITTKWYSFGMLAQNYNTKSYRFGFNGKENDNEVIGKGRWQDYGARMYRPDLARFFSPDPLIVYEKKYPELSSYQFASNTPIMAIDLDGLEPNYIATRNNNGETKLTIPVIGMLAALYGQPIWMAGSKANIKINQKIHDDLTGYKTGAITLGFDINYTKDYENKNAEQWLLLTSHEIVHVVQFIRMFRKDFEDKQTYQDAVGKWMFSYGLEAVSTWIDNPTKDKEMLHDKISVENEANKKAAMFKDFFKSQYYKKEDGTYGNKVIDLLQKAEKAKQNKDKKAFRNAYNELIDLVESYKLSIQGTKNEQ